MLTFENPEESPLGAEPERAEDRLLKDVSGGNSRVVYVACCLLIVHILLGVLIIAP